MKIGKIEASQMNQKHFISDEGVEITYYKPSQVREIPVKQGSVRGYIPSLKPNMKGNVLNYESQLERNFLYLLDQDPNCIDIQTQPCHVHYKTKNNRKVKATPDVWAIFQDGCQYLFEVKPEKKLKELEKDKNWQLKTKAIIQYCENPRLDWKYRIITERNIRGVRLNNIKDMLGAAKHYSPVKININIGNFDIALKSLLQKSPTTFEDVIFQLENIISLKKSEIISLLKYKIYYNRIAFNWNVPFREAVLFISPPKNISSDYLSGEKEHGANKELEEFEMDEGQETVMPSKKDQQAHDLKLTLISSIIEIFGKNAKKSEILDICLKKNLPFSSVYRWYLIWKKEGHEGLYRKKSKDLRKNRIKNKLASELLSAFIKAWNRSELQSLKKAYENYYTICVKQGIPKKEIPSDQTFRNWIRKLPAVEKHGKFKPSRQKHIKKGLRSTYKEGRYPGAIIQMDHTLLDIWLVDSFTKQPLGRPWITAGTDVFSRNLWCFYLSFEDPSQESVLKAIFNGLIPKKELADWNIFEKNCLKEEYDPKKYELPCAGYPALIQVDNGRDFQANSVKEFFMKNNITLEFRPSYTPNYGGYIESPWDTFNDAIRGDKLPGRVFPIPKSRDVATNRKFKIPPGYDAKKEAKLTLDEFQEWFFRYITARYCSEPKASQTQSPNEVWDDGLNGNHHHTMGGSVKIASPQEYEILNFLSKRKATAILNEKGLRYKNIYYTSEWLIEARKKGLKGRQEFRISHLDIRYVQIIDPNSSQIETLTAYNYRGDDLILTFILTGLGKIQRFKGFPISLKTLNYAKKELERTQYDKSGGLLLMDSIGQKIQKNKKLTRKDIKFINTVSKSKEGRGTMAQSVKNLQEQGGIEENDVILSQSPLKSRGNADDFKVTFPINKNPLDNIPPEIMSSFNNVTFPISPKNEKELEHKPSEMQSSFYNVTFPIDQKNKKIKSSKDKNDKKKNNH